jgi:hypothetical protein
MLILMVGKRATRAFLRVRAKSKPLHQIRQRKMVTLSLVNFRAQIAVSRAFDGVLIIHLPLC